MTHLLDTVLEQWAHSPGALRLGSALLHFVWQGALLAIAAVTLMAVLKRARPQVRYVALLLLLGAMALCPAITFCVVGSNVAAVDSNAGREAYHANHSSSSREAHIAASNPPEANLSIDSSRGTKPQPLPDTNSSSSVDSTWIEGAEDTSAWKTRLVPFYGWLVQHRHWMVAAWFAGVCLLSVRLLVGLLGAERARRCRIAAAGLEVQQVVTRLAKQLGVRRKIQVVQSALVDVPMLVGWISPVILLPVSAISGLSPAELEAILAHEVAHIRRHDYLVNLLQTVMETVLFYHPAVWWLSQCIRQEREHCCDDMAVAICPDRVLYARALAAMEELRLTPRWAVAARGGSLIQRIRRVVRRQESTDGMLAFVALAAVLTLMVSVAVPIPAKVGAQEQAAAQPNKEPPNETKTPAVAKTPREELDALVQDFRDAPQKALSLQRKRNAAAGAAAKAAFEKRPPDEIKALRQAVDDMPSFADMRAATQARAHADGFLRLIEKYPSDPVAIEALEWLLEYDEAGPAALKAISLVNADLLQSESLARACSLVTPGFGKAGDEFLRLVVDKNPHRLVQATARRSQALRLANKVEWAQQEAAGSDTLREHLNKRHLKSIENYDRTELIRSGTAQAEALFKQLLRDYGDVTYPSGKSIKDLAEADLRSMKSLTIGCSAPEIDGLDMDGRPMKLSDARGHVVLLEFWGTWCGPCMALVPEHIKLVQRMDKKPFMLLGVDSDRDRDTAKKRSAERGIVWRSWFDGAPQGRHTDGVIARRWNVNSWPTMYLIDAKGVIRFKGDVLQVRGDISDAKRVIVNGFGTSAVFNALDDCVDLLVKEAELAQTDGSVSVGPLAPAKFRPAARAVLPMHEVHDSTKLTAVAANRVVQQELGIAEGTANKLAALQEEYFEELRNEYEAKGVVMPGIQPRTGFQPKNEILAKLDNQFAQKIRELISDQQFKRLKQIRVWVMRSSVLTDPEIAQELALTAAQKNQLSMLSRELSQKTREFLDGNRTTAAAPPPRTAAAEQMNEYRERHNAERQAFRQRLEATLRELDSERDRRMAEILTSEQNAKFAEMKGEPFDVSQLVVQSQPPAPRGAQENTRPAGKIPAPTAPPSSFPRLAAAPSSQMIAGVMVRVTKDAKTDRTNVHFGQAFVAKEHIEFLKKQPNLGDVSIYTRGTPLTDDDLRQLAALPLTGLDVAAGESVTDRGLAAFKDHSSLRSLGLHRAQITTEGLDTLLTIPTLDKVYFANASITDAGLAKLGQIKSLKSVDFRGCNEITDIGMQSLCRSGNLEEVMLVSNAKLTGRIAQYLRGQSNLTWLTIYNLKMTADDMAELGAQSRLTTLRLGNCGLTDDGTKRLAKLTELETLTLRDPGLTDGTSATLAGLPRLEKLSLESAMLTDAALPNLAKLTTLKSLALWGTAVTVEGLPLLARLKKLTALDLTQTKLSEADIASLRDALPQVTITKLPRVNGF